MGSQMLPSALRRYGPYLVAGFTIWVVLRVLLPLTPSTSNIWWHWMAPGFFLIFLIDDLLGAWTRYTSKNFVIFPGFYDSSHQQWSHDKLEVDAEGKIPPHETILFHGTHRGMEAIDLRDKHIAIVPVGSVEHFGVGERVRIVHAPIIPVENVDALSGFFGGSYGHSKRLSYIGRKGGEGYFSFLNMLLGENTPERAIAQHRYASVLEMSKKDIQTIASREEAIIESIRRTHAETQEGWFTKRVEAVKRRWRR